MWSPIKLNFLFYDFSMIYYNFSKIWPNKLKKKKIKTFYSKTFVLKHTILYVYSIDLLMWSPKNLDFLFYNFSMDYYDFSKIQPK